MATDTTETISELLFGPGADTSETAVLINHKGERLGPEALAGKAVGVYFSAHWVCHYRLSFLPSVLHSLTPSFYPLFLLGGPTVQCPPCRGFTPVLADVYNKCKEQNKPFEVVFISSDSDQESFDEYFAEMPWIAVPYANRQLNGQMSEKFGITGIPTLLIFDENGKFLHDDGSRLVYEDGADGHPFAIDPVKEAAKEAAAKAAQEEFKRKQEELLASLPKEVKDERHEHPLALMPQVYYGNYGCDICSGGKYRL